jgi:quinol monooxygenase YgiN
MVAATAQRREGSMDEGLVEQRKYIVGWLTCRPGKRDALLTIFAPYARACLAEAGCRFFEVGPSVHDEDVVVVSECFSSREAHDVHLRSERFRAFQKLLPDYCLRGRFENVFSGDVEPDTANFESELR